MRFTCILCFSRSCMQLKSDKKGRPFAKCGACGSMVFLHAREALRGLGFLPQLLDREERLQEIAARLDADPVFAPVPAVAAPAPVATPAVPLAATAGR